ncbi:conjugal transfer protein TrbD [Vibrio parahaemolyticus]|uniref:conjugal transfer protein TrbD n=1 Tax=Vibrio parahaemolyticus TaxID=670 RepID=UPI00177CB4F4|nr:conjugal transfer protein TrbD [Vibrio parahaemolyticus]MBD6979699.1 hypothetical protein [Vibrio parahaemolyticus]
MDDDDELQFTPIYPFNRANLFMGGDRFLVMGAGCLALVLVVLQNIYTAVIGVVLFLVMLLITRLMAKNDAQLRPVYRRYAKFQRYYPLLPRRWRQVSTQTVSLSSRSLTRALFFASMNRVLLCYPLNRTATRPRGSPIYSIGQP